MAAKVVMVAVPTVLGMASIRVYSAREAPSDGLVTREKLNVYTPLLQSAQGQFVPETPGVIESGLTSARESVTPFVQAVKGACVSVKTGSVNLYYAGEDVYYYLKDPPPGFLPRFGTITMAGLLGMVLARKGSRFKQLAVPLGLMSAGASVCYPAQAIAVLKVAGKKMYAAGQWSSTTVSSLFLSKPLEPVDKDIAASQPQSSTDFAVVEQPSESSSAQRALISEPQENPAESVPFSDESVVAGVTEETLLVTLTDISPEQAPTENHTESMVDSEPSKRETTITSEEAGVPIKSEVPPDTKQDEISPEVSTVETTPSFESEAVTSAPSSVETPATRASDEPTVPIKESVKPEIANQPPVAAVEEPTPTLPALPPKQPVAESQKGGSGFKPDASLMDFGQSSPEDEDLYSTRS